MDQEEREFLLRRLSHRAIAAFASRCARRLQPLAFGLDRDGQLAVERAITLTESFARGELNNRMSASEASAMAWSYARVASSYGWSAAAAASGAAWVAAPVARDVALSTAVAIWSAAEESDDESLIRAAVDLNHLNRFYRQPRFRLLKLKSALGSPIDPSEKGPLGPLWPYRPPRWFARILPNPNNAHPPYVVPPNANNSHSGMFSQTHSGGFVPPPHHSGAYSRHGYANGHGHSPRSGEYAGSGAYSQSGFHPVNPAAAAAAAAASQSGVYCMDQPSGVGFAGVSANPQAHDPRRIHTIFRRTPTPDDIGVSGAFPPPPPPPPRMSAPPRPGFSRQRRFTALRKFFTPSGFPIPPRPNPAFSGMFSTISGTFATAHTQTRF